MGGDGAGPGTTAAAAPVAIELRDIVKRFPGVVANDGVNLTVAPAAIHAIVGENGAGKSTLMKTLYGAHRPDEGTIVVNGAEQPLPLARATPSTPASAWCSSTSCSPTTSRCGRTSCSATSRATPCDLDIRGARRRIRELGRALRPRRRSRRARRRPRRRREAARRDPQGALPRRHDPDPRRADRGARAARGRRAVRARCASSPQHGATVIFISHKLDEVLGNADAITVIRAGQDGRRGRRPVAPSPPHQLAEMMVGSELPSPETRETHGDRP